MKKVNFKKALATLILVCGVAFPTAAFASSTGFVYDFTHQLTSQKYPISGSNCTIDTNTTYYTGSQSSNKLFYIDLYRYHSILPNEYISTSPEHKYGSDYSTWNGVGAGTYYFIFNKDEDGQDLQGTGTIHG